ncbi:MAG TPA: leucine-rich repeat domain-containing protein [Mucilaginibacter sp.]|jgi:Leucine-rich repeat (LRR) protein|nr:leucine-rich repeat domain-containing protein [Mucilaginibacter sp.]
MLSTSVHGFAQENENWIFKSVFSGKYYGKPYDTRMDYFDRAESGRFNIKSLVDARLIIQKKLADVVIAVELEHIATQDLQSIFVILAKFPNLSYIRLRGLGTTNPNEIVDQLVTDVGLLKNLKAVEFAYADGIDMDAALKKLRSLRQLQALSFTEYNGELPASINLLKQVDSIKINARNVTHTELNGVNWKKLLVVGDPKSWSDKTGNLTKEQSKTLLKLAQIKSLRQLNLYVDLRYPKFISNFTQITELNINDVIDDKNALPLAEAIDSLKQLQKLSIDLAGSGHSFDIMPLKDLTQLRSLFLKLNDDHGNGLEVLSNFKNLEFLEIIQSRMSVVPDVFKDMAHLKTVDFCNNGIFKVPASLFNVPSLQNLDLSHNRLTYLPPLSSYGCTRLKHVNLMMNQLTSLPQAFSSLLNLETINCSNNKIETLPGGWAYLTHLKEANFAINHLTEFPEGLQNNRSVERITLFFNNIETFPDVDGDDYKLRYLGITGNRNMFELPQHIGSYTQLDTLEAQYLNLNGLPESLGDCKNLKTLLLSRSITKKTILPPGLKDAKSLAVLELNDNPLLDHLSIFDVILSQPRQNLTINLANSDIRRLPSTNKWLSIPFVYMNLRDNPISELPQELINSKVKGTIDTKSTNIRQ